MPLWLQMSRNYSNPESVNYKLAYLREQIGDAEFGKLAYADQVELAMLGKTIAIGGFLRTELIKAKSIKAEHLDIDTLSAITANLGTMRSFPSSKTFGPFTEADRDRVQAILLQTITPTPDDYEKYDINRNGVIDIADLLKIQKRVIEGGTVTVNYEVIINSDDPSSLIEAVATYTPDGTVERTKIGAGGIVSSTVITDRLIPSGGFTGSFTTGDGKSVHVNNGIITAVL